MNFPKIPDKLYDILKWFTLIVLPAFGTLYSKLSNIWSLPYGEQVASTVIAVVAFLGVVLGISTYAYNKQPTTVDVLEYADDVEDYEVEYDLDEDTEDGDAE